LKEKSAFYPKKCAVRHLFDIFLPYRVKLSLTKQATFANNGVYG